MKSTNFDENIFNEKYKKYSTLIFRIAYQYTFSKEIAEDIMQEVFIKLLVYEKPFKDSEHEKAWLIRVTVNHAKNIIKAKNYNTVALNEDIQFNDSFERSNKKELL